MIDRHHEPLLPDPEIVARERIAEIGEILAAGLIRLQTPKSSPLVAPAGERSLDCVGHQSGHDNSEAEKA